MGNVGPEPASAAVCVGGVVALPTRLEEYCARETGKRSPTKNVAGWPSSARSRTRRPAWTLERKFESVAVAPGNVPRKVVLPPPKANTGGIEDADPKTCVSKVFSAAAPPCCTSCAAFEGIE